MPRLASPVKRRVQHRPQAQPRDLREGQFTDGGRLRRGLLTPRSFYRPQILRMLLAAEDHALPSRQIRRTIERRMNGRFTAADLSALRSGQPRWVNSMQWERKKMVMDGLLDATDAAGHGLWRLTREGVRAARSES